MRGVKDYKNPSIVSGLSVKQILSMDVAEFNKLGLKDLQKITGRLVSASNKRYRRAKQAGVESPAFTYVENTGLFSTKGKNLNQLRAEFVRAKNFLDAETSTIKGAKKFMSESIKMLKQEGVNISEDKFKDVMKVYEELKRSNPKVRERQLKYSVLQEIEKRVEPDSNFTKNDDRVKKIVTEMHNQLEDIYKQSQEGIEDGVSGFFTVDDEESDDIPF